MTSTEKNIVRAKQIVDNWPEWKQKVQLTKFKSSSKEYAKVVTQRQPQPQS